MAAPNFTGIAVIDADPYTASGQVRVFLAGNIATTNMLRSTVLRQHQQLLPFRAQLRPRSA
jgi:hypothetical protein